MNFSYLDKIRNIKNFFLWLAHGIKDLVLFYFVRQKIQQADCKITNLFRNASLLEKPNFNILSDFRKKTLE